MIAISQLSEHMETQLNLFEANCGWKGLVNRLYQHCQEFSQKSSTIEIVAAATSRWLFAWRPHPIPHAKWW